MIRLYKGAERPGCTLHWLDTIGTPVDFTDTTWTYSFSLEQDLVTTVISGATVSANANPTTDTGSAADVPSLSVSFAAGALDNIAVGPATLRVDATAAGRNRRLKIEIEVDE